MLRLAAAFLILLFTTGCVAAPIILVGAGVVGGYAVSRDTIEGNTSKSIDELWDAASKVLAIMGSVDNSDRKRGEITARVNGAVVTLTVIPINTSTAKLRVKARKNLLPAVAVAQEVFTKVISQLEQ